MTTSGVEHNKKIRDLQFEEIVTAVAKPLEMPRGYGRHVERAVGWSLTTLRDIIINQGITVQRANTRWKWCSASQTIVREEKKFDMSSPYYGAGTWTWVVKAIDPNLTYGWAKGDTIEIWYTEGGHPPLDTAHEVLP